MSYHTIADMCTANEENHSASYQARRILDPANIDPKFWGPCFWKYYHIMSLHYPAIPTPKEQLAIKSYILTIPSTLPCEACKIHATKYISERMDQLDRITSCQQQLFRFFVEFHNYVNARQGKQIWTVDQAYTYWNKEVHNK